ncbi:hypothetical protein ACE0DR_13710 [Azotobacter sp. CWF10]
MAHYADHDHQRGPYEHHPLRLPGRFAERAAIPRDLAALIVRKADSMARHFEAQATEQLTKAARSAWRRGMSAEEIAHQLGL